MFKKIVVAMCLTLGIVVCLLDTNAQSDLIGAHQELRYIRQVTESQPELIGLSSINRRIYELPSLPDCWEASDHGDYIALSSSVNPTSLVIWDFNTAEIRLQVSWQQNWQPCTIVWLSDNVLSILRSDVFNQDLKYQIVSDTLSPYEGPLGQSPALPTPPEQLRVDVAPELLLQSPQPSIYLYERCVGQFFLADGYQQCPEGIYATVYDESNQTFLARLGRSDPRISGYDTTSQTPGGNVKAAWSGDGRYLAYARVPESLNKYFDLAIRDLIIDENLNLDFPNEIVEYNIALKWSPVGHKLLFWLRGMMGEGDSTESESTTRHPIIFDADQGHFIWTSSPYEFPENFIGDPVQWSPDGQGLVFTDGSNNLIHLDAQTGFATLLDTNVSSVIDWVEVQTIPPTPTPTPSLVANAGPDQSHVIYIEDCQIVPCPPVIPISVTLDGSNSTGAITAYEWTRNGQVVSTQASFTTNLGPGSHVFTLKVSNASGNATDSVTILVSTCDPFNCSAIMSPTGAPEQ